METQLPYDRLPIERIVVHEIPGTGYGRSPIYDLIAPQEALNLLNSCILTNLNATALQMICVPEGYNINASDMQSGVLFVTYPQGMTPPQGISLSALPPQLGQFAQSLQVTMNNIVGVSDVARGQTASPYAAGTSLALQGAMSAQNQGPVLTQFQHFAGRVATLLLKILRTYAVNPRTLAIIGKDKSTNVLYSQDDLEDFDRIYVTPGNPLASTTAGKLQMAQDLAQKGLLTDPHDYMMVAKTGNLDYVMDPIEKELEFIQRENELLRDGQNLTPLFLDNHAEHIAHHRELTQDTDLRLPTVSPQQAKVLQAIMDHIQQHQQMMQQSGPGAQPAPAGAQAPPNSSPNGKSTQGAPKMPQPAQPAQPPNH
jgi:hypothetical protein